VKTDASASTLDHRPAHGEPLIWLMSSTLGGRLADVPGHLLRKSREGGLCSTRCAEACPPDESPWAWLNNICPRGRARVNGRRGDRFVFDGSRAQRKVTNQYAPCRSNHSDGVVP